MSEILHALYLNLSSPMVLAFALGIIATILRSNLKFPDAVYPTLTIYLLFAIGFKGGVKLEGVNFSDFWQPALAAIALCLAIPLWTYFILRKFARFDVQNAAAVAAHFGSVSAVTFGEAIAFLDNLHIHHEAFLPALLAIMEVPAIIVAILLANLMAPASPDSPKTALSQILRNLLTGKSVLLLLGGMAVGLLSGKRGLEQVAPFFDAPFRGVLTLFLLEVGLITGQRLADLKKAGPFLAVFSIIMPLLHGTLGILLAHACGLSLGGAVIFATLAASASYIAAPAAARVALPQANPAIYLTASLAITFPFNVVIGVPLYYAMARYWYNA